MTFYIDFDRSRSIKTFTRFCGATRKFELWRHTSPSSGQLEKLLLKRFSVAAVISLDQDLAGRVVINWIYSNFWRINLTFLRSWNHTGVRSYFIKTFDSRPICQSRIKKILEAQMIFLDLPKMLEKIFLTIYIFIFNVLAEHNVKFTSSASDAWCPPLLLPICQLPASKCLGRHWHFISITWWLCFWWLRLTGMNRIFHKTLMIEMAVKL